jgi:hypothetical protein
VIAVKLANAPMPPILACASARSWDKMRQAAFGHIEVISVVLWRH